MVKIRPSKFGAPQKGKRNIAVARKKNSEHVDLGLHCRTIAHERVSPRLDRWKNHLHSQRFVNGGRKLHMSFPRAQCYIERSAGGALLGVWQDLVPRSFFQYRHLTHRCSEV